MRPTVRHDGYIRPHAWPELFSPKMRGSLCGQPPAFRIEGQAGHGVERFVNIGAGAWETQRLSLIEDAQLPVRIGDGGGRGNDFRKARTALIRLRVGTPGCDAVAQEAGTKSDQDALEGGLEEPGESTEAFFEKMAFVLNH